MDSSTMQYPLPPFTNQINVVCFLIGLMHDYSHDFVSRIPNDIQTAANFFVYNAWMAYMYRKTSLSTVFYQFENNTVSYMPRFPQDTLQSQPKSVYLIFMVLVVLNLLQSKDNPDNTWTRSPFHYKPDKKSPINAIRACIESIDMGNSYPLNEYNRSDSTFGRERNDFIRELDQISKVKDILICHVFRESQTKIFIDNCTVLNMISLSYGWSQTKDIFS
jgi:AAA+ ATPase superfamily predicted ATPase